MSIEKLGNITLVLGDCMEYMAICDDKAFDLSIVDPPYGGANCHICGGVKDSLADSIGISRTGGTWAEKYGKKS